MFLDLPVERLSEIHEIFVTAISSRECNFMKAGVLQNKNQVWCTLLFLTLKRSMYTISSRESPFCPFQPGRPWEMKTNKTVTYRKSLFDKPLSRFGAALTGKPGEPWMPGRPGNPGSPSVPLQPSAPGFPLGPACPGWPCRENVRMVRRTYRRQNQFNTLRLHLSGETYRNAIASRKPRNTGHSLQR